MQKLIKSFTRQVVAPAVKRAAKEGARVNRRIVASAVAAAVKSVKPAERPPGDGDWIAGVAVTPAGSRRFRLYRPPGLALGERLPLLVMLHGCGQDAASFATSTRMNAVAARERFMVLYPEQDRLANGQACWNWFETRSGKAFAEVGIVLAAIDQAALLYAADATAVALAGLSAGASLAALAGALHPGRFKAVAMHSGVAPGAAHDMVSAMAAMHGRPGAVGSPAQSLAFAAAPTGERPPLLVIHGRDDRVVASSNAVAAVEAWARHGHALPTAPKVLQRGQRHRSTITQWKRAGRCLVTLCEVDALGHAWSGGKAGAAFSDARGPDASRMVAAFFKRHIGR